MIKLTVFAFIVLGLVASSLQNDANHCDSIKPNNGSLINNESNI